MILPFSCNRLFYPVLIMSSVFHFTPLTLLSPNSSTELEHSSPHTSTPGDLSVLLPFPPLLIPPPSCLIWKGCSLDLTQVISRCHLIRLLSSHGGNSFTFPRFPHVWFIIASWQSTSSAATQERVMGGQFGGPFMSV